MIDMYEEYGYYKEGQYSITMKGKEGAEQIAAIMEKLRNNPLKTFGNWKVEEFRDYKTDKVINMETGEESKTGLPSSNVLYFALNDDSWCCARPSGTEPKIKFYMGVKGKNLEDAEKLQNELTEAVKNAVG